MKALLPLLLICGVLNAQTTVYIDEDFSEWEAFPPAVNDNIGDGRTGSVDFEKLWIESDDDYLFIRMDVGKEINLQDNNYLTLYIDTDNNSNTGYAIKGIGAEIEFWLGAREGLFYGNSTVYIRHADIGLVTAPTVTSETFELAIRRDASVFGTSIFQGNDIKVALIDNQSSGDEIPNGTGGISYRFHNTGSVVPPDFNIARPNDIDLRLLSYNVFRDDFFENSTFNAYSRILKAIQPDLIGFVEIYDHSSGATVERLKSMLNTTENFYHSRVNPDIVVVSRYPIIRSYSLDGNGAFLINKNGEDILFIVTHLPCCENDEGRQDEVDNIMSFIRDAKNGIGSFTIMDETPIIIVGDMNFVGKKRQVETLLEGNISNNNFYGSDFSPDWDGTDLEDAKPYTTGLPMTFTWYSEGSSFYPGRLDYVIYSGSVLDMENSYSLYTPALSNNVLQANGLQRYDTNTASDHTPLIIDFKFKNSTTATTLQHNPDLNWTISYDIEQERANLSYELSSRTTVRIEIIDTKGQIVKVINYGEQAVGAYSSFIRLDELTSGVYIGRLYLDKYFDTKKMVIMH